MRLQAREFEFAPNGYTVVPHDGPLLTSVDDTKTTFQVAHEMYVANADVYLDVAAAGLVNCCQIGVHDRRGVQII